MDNKQILAQWSPYGSKYHVLRNCPIILYPLALLLLIWELLSPFDFYTWWIPVAPLAAVFAVFYLNLLRDYSKKRTTPPVFVQDGTLYCFDGKGSIPLPMDGDTYARSKSATVYAISLRSAHAGDGVRGTRVLFNKEIQKYGTLTVCYRENGEDRTVSMKQIANVVDAEIAINRFLREARENKT